MRIWQCGTSKGADYPVLAKGPRKGSLAERNHFNNNGSTTAKHHRKITV